RQGTGAGDGRAPALARRAARARPRRRRPGRGHLPPQPGAAGGAGGGGGVIALVRGELVARRPDSVVVDCGGVGYRLAVSAHTLGEVPPVGREVALHTHLIVRDDSLQLFGFASEEERELFLMLIGVQSVGPKVA